MQYLIDTHVFLWFVSQSKELSPTAKTLIEDGQNEIFISIASLWEILIKTAIGKLNINGSYESVIDDVNDNAMQIFTDKFRSYRRTKPPAVSSPRPVRPHYRFAGDNRKYEFYQCRCDFR